MQVRLGEGPGMAEIAVGLYLAGGGAIIFFFRHFWKWSGDLQLRGI
jgi:hypothetical protein